ncbi:MAG: G-D-S-L family lipolytic protein [Chitinophaga sp.]|nr:G-D-S-L family lipolytic protein [Chitinophaga sp.]
MKQLVALIITLLVAAGSLQSQTNAPFAADIAAFKKQDSIQFPAKHQILFIGSSSFTKWKTVQQDFPDYKILNRAFGGSTLVDVIRYVGDVVYPYKPKQIIIYCGENDIAASDTVTAAMVLQRFQTLYKLIRNKYKKIEIDYVSIKPSPVRIKFRPVVEQANMLLKSFIATQKHAKFINVFNDMLNADGTIKQELFISDNLHMNEKGYAIWQRIIQPYLFK